MRGFKTCKIIYVGCLVVASCFAFFNNTASSALAAQTYYEIVDADSTTIHFVLDGVPFDFKKVEGGKMNLGPLGICNLDTYWMMETEFTNKLIRIINNLQNSFFINHFIQHSDEIYAAYYAAFIDYQDSPILLYDNYTPNSYYDGNSRYHYCKHCIESVISTFNTTYSGFSFALPSAQQWVFAARGGKLSEKFIYSGSNDIDNVAWFYGNSMLETSKGSGRIPHAAKQLSPNELGLYDMCGNAAEAINADIKSTRIIEVEDEGWYGSSYSTPRTISHFVYCGGDVLTEANKCYPSLLDMEPTYMTFRLVLIPNK